MTTILSVIAVAAAVAVTEDAAQSTQNREIEPPSHQVIALYFHRTQRCPTCKRIGALAEEAIVKGFAKEQKTKAVEFKLVDYQSRKNAELTEQFKIKIPTLVIVNVFDGEVVRSTPLPKVWRLVGKPKELQAYVQDGVTEYLQQTRKEAESKE